MRYLTRVFGVSAVLAFTAAACASNATSPTGTLPARVDSSPLATVLRKLRSHATGKIQHVVIIIQENRSFDNLLQGFPNADTRSYGYDSNGKKVTLNQITLATNWDIDHSSYSFITACDGKGKYPGTECRMNGFNNESIGCGGSSDPCPYPEPEYAYVPHSETAPYFAMGEQYVVADRMFESDYDSNSFISHQYIIAGQAGKSAVNEPAYFPWGCDASGNTIATVNKQRQIGAPYQQVCWDDPTLGDEADAAGVSWGYYTADVNGDGGLWSGYQAIRHIRYGPDWTNDVKTPQTQFFTDIQNGNLPAISWVTPTCANSDHAGCGSNTGPSWVTSLVNAIGQSKYWNSTAIFIFWDDYGGWYDHVAPKKLDYDGLGFRIPMIIISPYAKQGYVSHVPYEHGSILKFTEDQFGLGRLAATDNRATSPETDCFDFSKPPRKFSPFKAEYDRNFFLQQPPDTRVPDPE